jgi:uncharacterized OB-fold protein
MTQLADRTIKAPAVNPETTPYWEAASAGKLLLRRCTSCHKSHHYPRTLCPFCLGQTEWVESSGKGEIYTFALMRQAEQPYVIAYVQLEEGPAMMTNIVDCDASQLRIGQAVRVVFKPTENGPSVPMFTPA